MIRHSNEEKKKEPYSSIDEKRSRSEIIGREQQDKRSQKKRSTGQDTIKGTI